MDENVVEKQIREAKLVKDTMGSSGWAILERDMVEKVRELTTLLIDEHDMASVVRLQSEIKAYNVFFDITLTHYLVKTD